MPLFMDVHEQANAPAAPHVEGERTRDLAVRGYHGVSSLKYWYDRGSGRVYCLVDAPNKEAAAAMHREAHGLVSDELVAVV
ncbi:MAG: DUF4242 domain-containing protein [Chloroflexota bacterium]